MGIASPLEVEKAPLEGGRKAPPLEVGMQKSFLNVVEVDGQLMLGVVVAEVCFS